MRLNYINQADLAVSFTYEGYQIGGLSGIDYDAKTDTYIAESDNGTDGKPPAIFKFQFTGLTNPDGTPKINIIGTPIPLKGVSNVESVRFDPNGNGFWVTTEESKPHIYHYDKNGVSTKLKVPAYIENGARADLSLKGATFAPDGSYFVSMERNLTNDPTGYSRILKYDKNKNLVGEYVYYTDRPSTVGATSNGISEILVLDNTHLLVLERGFNANINEHANPNQSVNPIRIYKIDLSHAQNVIGQSSLSSAPSAVSKKLVFDSRNPSIAGTLTTEANKIDNIEEMTLGPKLPNGHQSIVLVSDNNFNPIQAKTQFISLELDNDNTSLLKNAGMQKADEIHVKGSGNVITCGTGHNQIFGDVGHNEYVLNRAFNSISTYTEIDHFDASKDDKLDLKKTLADTTFKNTTKDFTSLQKYVSVTNQGSDVNIGISQYGDNHFTTIATLHNQNNPVDLGSLVKQGAISYS